jgi:hypothetical protein
MARWPLLFLTAVACVVETPVGPSADPADGGGAEPDDGGSGDGPVVDSGDPAAGDTGAAGDGGAPDTAADTGDDDPSEYTYDDDGFEPTLDASAVEAAVGDAIAQVFAIDPNTIFDSFERVVNSGDSACPYYYDDYYELYGYDYWYGGCTASNDIVFDGWIYGYDYGDSLDYGSYKYHRYGWWYGDFAAADARDGDYDLSGYLYFADYEYTYGLRYFSTSITGAARSTMGLEADSWMVQDLSLALVLSGGYYPSYGSYVDLSGGVSGFEGDVQSVSFDGVHMADEGWGSDCPVEPSGSIGVRDGEGEWYEVFFDGPAYSGAMVFPPDCDGCGEVWWRGESLGTACPDLTGLTSWEGTPWEAR